MTERSVRFTMTREMLKRSDGRESMRVDDLVLVNEPLLPDEIKQEATKK